MELEFKLVLHLILKAPKIFADLILTGIAWKTSKNISTHHEFEKNI